MTRCYVIPVGDEHNDEQLVEINLRRAGITFWVRDADQPAVTLTCLSVQADAPCSFPAVNRRVGPDWVDAELSSYGVRLLVRADAVAMMELAGSKLDKELSKIGLLPH
jgi:hypothetical protein